jgi:hypothetical protein
MLWLSGSLKMVMAAYMGLMAIRYFIHESDTIEIGYITGVKKRSDCTKTESRSENPYTLC